jgi:general secretion pathway protein J
VLVVLVITSMLSVLLIDGVSQMLMIERRMSLKTREFRAEQLQQHWFRQVLAGGMASHDDPFEMNADRVTGLSLSPLADDQGVPRRFELTVLNMGDTTELRYHEGGEVQVVLARWDNLELRNTPHFMALNAGGTYQLQWLSKEGGPQWPAGVALNLPLLDGDELWHVAIIGRRTPRPRLQDQLGI